ncbi:glycoside hydrolase family 95 protein [Prolixibacteraceae bacterium JC049]|nr:glycoside hydrolase family 95 protein [Prolixibacteraceae bacterium JC049]
MNKLPIQRSLMLALLLLVGFSCKTETPDEQKHLKLFYYEPATRWQEEALPLGNGYVGAMFFGDPEKERIQITEETLWRGGPGTGEKYKYGIRKGAWKALPKVRKLLDEKKFEEAHELANKKLTGIINVDEANPKMLYGDYGALQTMGDLFIEVANKGDVSKYVRELDISDATARVKYEAGGVKYSRKYFASYPAKVLVYELSSNDEAGTNYQITFKTPHIKKNEKLVNGYYSLKGEVSGNKMPFEYRLKIETDKGTVALNDGHLTVKGANKLVIYQTTSTGYKNQFPNYSGNDYVGHNNAVFSAIENKSAEDIYAEHLADYHQLFNRVSIQLGKNSDRDMVATKQRLLDYFKGAEDVGFEALFFQYNRYLMIVGSRPGTMPLNLQGKWNNSVNPVWAADYHMNINQQMLYWPAEVTNLSECHMPLFDYTESLVVPGKMAAKEFFNARGWTVSTMNNPFGFAANGWKFPWGYFPGGAAWLCQHFWEHYLFTNDKQFLKERAYPIMKEAALFWIDLLVENENGKLVSCPSYSPEHGGISKGASMDHQIAWDILNNCIDACNVLEADFEFKALATATRDKISSPKIGRWGQLQEWEEDVDDPKNQHRHVSHLFALHPGKQISVLKTPELADAAKVSLKARGNGGTGWSLAWKINFWARLKNGNHAHKMLKELIDPINYKDRSRFHDCGGSYQNLLCSHPPFQLDGNMGGLAGMTEMLVQSHEGVIEVLPALPAAWSQGEVKGLKTRGGFELNIKWNNHQLTALQVKASKVGVCPLKINGEVRKLNVPSTKWIDVKL